MFASLANVPRQWLVVALVAAALTTLDGRVVSGRGTPDRDRQHDAEPQSPPFASQVATAFILGRVLDAETSQPVAGARATLTRLPEAVGASVAVSPSVGPPTPARTVVTDADGHLLFRELVRGRYSLTVSAIGYLAGSFLQRTPADTRVHVVELGEGERRTDVDVRLWRLGSISGAVVDENGRPASGANVTVLRRVHRVGRVSLIRAAMVIADDRGMYLAAGLPPAEYVVGVRVSQLTVPVSLSERHAAVMAGRFDATQTPPLLLELLNSGVPAPGATGHRMGQWVRQTAGSELIGYTPPPPRADGRVLAYRSSYYANADSLIAATPLTLRAGEERREVDLALNRVEGYRVSGRLVALDGPAGDLGVRLVPLGSEVLVSDRAFEAAVTVSDATGAFTFLGVLPGTYLLRSSRLPIARIPGQASAPVVWAEQSLTVAHDDLGDLLVTLRPGLKVSGRVRFLGDRIPPQRLDQISLGLRAVGADVVDRSSMSTVSSQGTFTTHGDVAGRYFVEARPPSGWTVQSISYAGKNVADEPLDLSTDVDDVLVTFSDAISRLSGTITGKDGSPDSQANAIVFPADSDGWRRDEFNVRRSFRITAKADGTFALSTIPAGSYYVVAVDDAVAAAWASPAVLNRLVAGATRVDIGEGQAKVVALKTFTLQ